MLVSINTRAPFIAFKRLSILVGMLLNHSAWAEHGSRALDSSGIPQASIINQIVRTESVDQLRHVLRSHQQASIKKAACLFQNENGLPPTFCFTAEMSFEEREQTTTVCISRARRAKLIPGHDDWTDDRCLKALQERKKDLQYANQ